MADIHIEDFYHDVARILIHLYNRFPRKGAVFVGGHCRRGHAG